MIEIRKANERGNVNLGWLDSKHTFSFGHYYDPQHMGFSELRVINDDTVIPGAGFATHSHRNMEIISYVLDGVIAHKDSEGHVEELPVGEVQVMSAGRGISHSEFNASKANPVHFLQIWIQPNQLNTEPGYQQKAFGRAPGITPLVSSETSPVAGTLTIKQDAFVSQIVLEGNTSIELDLSADRHCYIHQVNGELLIDDTDIVSGDGLKITNESKLKIANNSSQKSIALLFDLP